MGVEVVVTLLCIALSVLSLWVIGITRRLNITEREARYSAEWVIYMVERYGLEMERRNTDSV